MAVMVERAVGMLVAMAISMSMLMPQLSLAAVYKVGDSAGWTTMGGIDYKQWAATKTFHLGDVIIFEYISQFHNVMRVTHEMYKSCNVTKPLETHTTGNDTMIIKAKGHHFFVCGVPGHCQSGQKVDINVLRVSSVEAAAPTPSVFASPSVPAVSHSPPAPSPNQASATFKGGFGFVLLIGFVLVFFVGAVPALA